MRLRKNWMLIALWFALAALRNPARNSSPVIAQNTAHGVCLNDANVRTNTKQAAMRAVKPIPPKTKCIVPWKVMLVGERIGSVTNAPTPIWQNPNIPSNNEPQKCPVLVRSALRNPSAPAITSRPPITKFTIWTQPQGPRLSVLGSLRVNWNSERANAWIAKIRRKKGPATTPQESRLLVPNRWELMVSPKS